MRLKFYSNENFHLGAVEQLRSLGYDVLTSLEAGRANQRIPDEQVLEFARQESRAVLTFNRLHFVRLHKQSAIHHGILVCSEDPNHASSTRHFRIRVDPDGSTMGVFSADCL